MKYGCLNSLSTKLAILKVKRHKSIYKNNFKYKNHAKFRITLITVCYYHVTYAFQSESTLFSCLNFKELLARNRRDIAPCSNPVANTNNISK